MKKLLSHQFGESIHILIWAIHSRPTHRIEAKAEYESKSKGDPIKLLEMIKENPLSFDDKKKADIVIIDAMMNLMTTRQRDDEDLTNYTKCFKAVRNLCKEKYGGIFEIPTLTHKESTWTSDKEGSYKTAYASFLSILYLKNTDQTKYGSFIKKLAEDFATAWENVYQTHIKHVQHILSIHKYDQAYHDKQKHNEMIVTKVSSPQRMTIILPLGMYLI